MNLLKRMVIEEMDKIKKLSAIKVEELKERGTAIQKIAIDKLLAKSNLKDKFNLE